ncbi:MAG: CvpA family protein [Bacteroidota bacterium]
MPEFPFTVADLAIVGVLLVSAVLAFARGFVHEVLSMTAWVGAALAVVFGLPYARPIAHRFISLPLLADVAAGGVIFIVTLLILSLLTRAVSRQVQGSALNAVDRSLGFLFGLLRGAVLVCLAYIPVAWLMAPAEQPAWMRDARARPLVEQGAAMIQSLFDAHRPPAEQALDPSRERARKALETERMVRDMMTPDPKSPQSGGKSPPQGYSEGERRDLERLIDSDR